ncbi:MAG: ATP-binding cassette domain-containing protein [Proteobacteria bacterium]|nr:ATP-binding cassette domain-containing protein [Pseudomonadota bacterium]
MQIQNLGFAWPGQPPLFSRLDLAVPPGVTWLGGDEGTGKTTLLRLMAGELAPRAGTVQAGGRVFWVNPRADGCDGLTPGQCFDRVARQHPALDRALLHDLVHALDLAQHLPKRLDMLSTGSRRKVWLAAAFASGAALTLLDQPFAAVDKASMGVITGLLQEAATHPSRAWVVADHVAPAGVPLAAMIDLDAAS